MNVLDVALSFNERYAPGAAVVISSVAVNANASTKLRFHLFTEQVKDETLAQLKVILSQNHPKGEIICHSCDETLLNGLPYWASSRIAAIRCLYAQLLPDVDWCLHLDCDILCLANIEDIFSYRDDNYSVCAVREEDERVNSAERDWIYTHVKLNGYGLRINDRQYFNSGCMLMNLKKIRKDSSVEKLIAFFKEHPDIPSPDQDALNVVFVDQVKMMPARYNQSQLTLTDTKLMECPIIHYVSGNPWIQGLMCVANNRFWLWHEFADKFVWRKCGESVRNNFEHKTLMLKSLCYWFLRSSLGGLFASSLERTGFIRDAHSWRQSQIGSDISRRGVAEILMSASSRLKAKHWPEVRRDTKNEVSKIIHCCWFGGPKTKLAQKCRASWEKFALGWGIKEWNEENIGALKEIPGYKFFCAAISAKKWSAASDWVRMAALWKEGGVYLDYDVELIKEIESLGTEEWVASEAYSKTGIWLNPGSGIALAKGSGFAQEMLKRYEHLKFDAKREMMVWINDNMREIGGLKVLDSEVMSPVDIDGNIHQTERTIGIHWYAMSWASPTRRLMRWMRWHGMSSIVDLGLKVRELFR